MKLNHNELSLIIAGVKTLYSTVPKDSGEARYYADVYARLTEQPELDSVAKDFVLKFTDKVLERVALVKEDGITSEEARLRASALKDIYVGIKEKLNVKSK